MKHLILIGNILIESIVEWNIINIGSIQSLKMFIKHNSVILIHRYLIANSKALVGSLGILQFFSLPNNSVRQI